MERKEMIDLLSRTRNLLHKQEEGETLTRLDVTLAHDYVDMVINALVDQEFALKLLQKDLESSEEIDEWLIHQLDMADDYASREY